MEALLVTEQERHLLPVVNAVLISFHQSKGQRCPHVTVVAVLLPDASRTHNVVPRRTAGDDKSLLNGNEVAAVLHKLETEVCNVPPCGVGSGVNLFVVAQKSKAAARYWVRQRQSAFKTLRRCSRIGGHGKAGIVVDRGRRTGVREELAVRENTPIYKAAAGQRIAGNSQSRSGGESGSQ